MANLKQWFWRIVNSWTFRGWVIFGVLFTLYINIDEGFGFGMNLIQYLGALFWAFVIAVFFEWDRGRIKFV